MGLNLCKILSDFLTAGSILTGLTDTWIGMGDGSVFSLKTDGGGAGLDIQFPTSYTDNTSIFFVTSLTANTNRTILYSNFQLCFIDINGSSKGDPAGFIFETKNKTGISTAHNEAFFTAPWNTTIWYNSNGTIKYTFAEDSLTLFGNYNVTGLHCVFIR